MIATQDPLHEEVGRNELVSRRASPATAEYPSDRSLLGELRHVAILTAALVAEIAMQPLLIGHLLRQGTDLVSVGVQGLGDERVAGCAELGSADVITSGRHEVAGGRVHDSLQPGVDVERPVLEVGATEGTIDRKSAGEAGWRPEVRR